MACSQAIRMDSQRSLPMSSNFSACVASCEESSAKVNLCSLGIREIFGMSERPPSRAAATLAAWLKYAISGISPDDWSFTSSSHATKPEMPPRSPQRTETFLPSISYLPIFNRRNINFDAEARSNVANPAATMRSMGSAGSAMYIDAAAQVPGGTPTGCCWL
eukprot:CAMPEP_0177276968 /NCGR_PEP_ID=MMETSP0367-20130122/68541_1 /TAXON_ID=447022 ORGANISM="Scrippsiella hangoei-like, Strain SHHI-4" /NCGR_SAMPLE_ID=MMETSP0367 /ASSEMBLY_ACC=CAM_ASM_000362 /LENGTH=161 /DNA_ID=CAMNT_0018733521 /DNA_START=247 /DNA_END=735 /DNA_ORIENTATION=+